MGWAALKISVTRKGSQGACLEKKNTEDAIWIYNYFHL